MRQVAIAVLFVFFIVTGCGGSTKNNRQSTSAPVGTSTADDLGDIAHDGKCLDKLPIHVAGGIAYQPKDSPYKSTTPVWCYATVHDSAVLYSLYGSPETAERCSKNDASSAFTALSNKLVEFADETKLAGSTGRIALAPVISQMQATRRATDQLPLAKCATVARRQVTLYMDERIAEFLAFAAQASDADVHVKGLVADDYLNDTSPQMNELRAKSGK